MDSQDVVSLRYDESIEFLVFQVGKIRCGIDILEIEGINWVPSITPVYSAPDYVKGLLNLRGQVVTVLDLGKRLGFANCRLTKKSRVIIIRSGLEFIGLLVDSISEVISSQDKSIEIPPVNTMEAQGAYCRGILKKENKLTAILNIEEIIKADE